MTKALADALQAAEDRRLPPAPGDEFSVFSATMLGVPVPFYNDDQVEDAQFRILMSYRTIDVFLYSLSCLPQHAVLPLRVAPHKKLPLTALNNLRTLVTSTHTNISSYLLDNSTLAPPSLDLGGSPVPDSPMFRLYASLAGKVAKRGTLNTVINVLTAALHLGYLLSGNNALACALSSSPLTLLSGRNLHDAPGKDALLNQWSSIGGAARPSPDAAIEKAIWRVLFSGLGGGDILADLAATLRDLEPTAAEAVPWLLLDSDLSDSSAAFSCGLRRGRSPTPIGHIETLKEPSTVVASVAGSSFEVLGAQLPDQLTSSRAVTPAEDEEPVSSGCRRPQSAPSPVLKPTLKPEPKPKPKPKPKPASIPEGTLNLEKKSQDRTPRSTTAPVDHSSLEETACSNYFEVIQIVDLTGEDSDTEMSWRPEAKLIIGDHKPYKEDYEWFGSMFDAAVAHHVDGLPRYLSADPLIRKSSALEIIAPHVYADLHPSDVLRKLRTANIVVVGGPVLAWAFDKDSLGLLANLEATITLHDLSLPVSDSDDRTRKGTPLDLLHTLEQKYPKALSGLSFPLIRDPFPPQKFSSDDYAWSSAQGSSFCKSRKPYPVTEMRWGLASTGGTYHHFHIDADGYGTFMVVDHGYKLWFLASPKSRDFGEFASIDLYTGSYKKDDPNCDLWDVELLVLGPDAKIIMRPNQPHTVCTPLNSICRGGHFYGSSTLRDMFAAIIHIFFAGNLLTNTDHGSVSHAISMCIHTASLRCLTSPTPPGFARDLTHVLDVATWDGVLDLLFLCNYFELYKLKRAIKNRQRARSLIHWFFSSHTLTPLEGGPPLRGGSALAAVYAPLLAHHAKLLVVYKTEAYNLQFEGLLNISPEQVATAVEDCMRDGPAWSAFEVSYVRSHNRTFAWMGPTYSVEQSPRVDLGAVFISMLAFAAS
ncbi:hypothetical protein DXG01_010806 [Tephrocybe rancida]|nr:hypothetical protein DXG01_010806 [Tephrocybe rancida]